MLLDSSSHSWREPFAERSLDEVARKVADERFSARSGEEQVREMVHGLFFIA
jgi:hypothetical protein